MMGICRSFCPVFELSCCSRVMICPLVAVSRQWFVCKVFCSLASGSFKGER